MTGGVPDKTLQFVTVASGLVAALAWNTAVQKLFTAILERPRACSPGWEHRMMFATGPRLTGEC